MFFLLSGDNLFGVNKDERNMVTGCPFTLSRRWLGARI